MSDEIALIHVRYFKYKHRVLFQHFSLKKSKRHLSEQYHI